MVEHLSSVCKDLGFHLSLEKKQRGGGEKRGREKRRVYLLGSVMSAFNSTCSGS